MKNNVKYIFKKAHTIAEVIIVFALIAFIGTISISVMSHHTESDNKIRIKTSYMEITQILDNILDNPRYYSSASDFTDTSSVKLFGGEEFNGGDTKFREIIMYEMGQKVNNYISCEAMNTDGNISLVKQCFQSDNETIWHIPRSDFNIDTYRYNGANYVPIVFYPDPKPILRNDSNYFNREAVILGVARDGSIALIKTVDCKNKSNKEHMQCLAETYISDARATQY